jgi:hypothetical protein
MILRTAKEIVVPLQTLRLLRITMVAIRCLAYLFKTSESFKISQNISNLILSTQLTIITTLQSQTIMQATSLLLKQLVLWECISLIILVV